MDKLIINGAHPLSGEICISSSKNSSLPILAATLLAEGQSTLMDLPHLRDVYTLKKLLTNLGALITTTGPQTCIKTSRLHTFSATYDIVKTMRASILVLGPLIAKYGVAQVSLPGGCAIGTRPIDLHLEGLKKLGASISIKKGYIHATAKKLQGNQVSLQFPSVGATENLMMAAALARGETLIENVAKEPEISDLAQFINKMGGKIEGAGTSSLHIQGVETLRGVEYRPMPDRIETATYLLAGLICRSPITLRNCIPEHLQSVLAKLKEVGCHFSLGQHSIGIQESWDFRPVKIETQPYPDFPTDVQAQMMAFLSTIKGKSLVSENIFENRFMHVAELRRMGAHISLDGNQATVQGGGPFSGAPVMCTDLRASAALVLAALSAKGKTQISRVYHLDRGHEKIEHKLKKLGADIRRIS